VDLYHLCSFSGLNCREAQLRRPEISGMWALIGGLVNRTKEASCGKREIQKRSRSTGHFWTLEEELQYSVNQQSLSPVNLCDQDN
jgi:hypothetical protein